MSDTSDVFVMKIHDGTRSEHGGTLCRTCSGCVFAKAGRESDDISYCVHMKARPPHIVVSCTFYEDRRLPSRWDLEKIACIITTDPKTKTIGFVDPKKWRSLRPDDEYL